MKSMGFGYFVRGYFKFSFSSCVISTVCTDLFIFLGVLFIMTDGWGKNDKHGSRESRKYGKQKEARLFPQTKQESTVNMI